MLSNMAYTKDSDAKVIGRKADDQDISCARREFNKERR